jgi:pyruvate/2-oxoglutarate dehydrogenase complex dihydrolipoamide acyltransferase (E2) component
MLNTINSRTGNVGDTFFAASRQMWLASLGAAVVTREWAQKEAGTVLRTLVKEGTAVESRAVRIVGDQVETSFAKANALWSKARKTVTFAVKDYADTAVMLVRETLPRSLPKVALPGLKANVPAKRKYVRKAKTVKARATRTVKKATRTVKKATRGVKRTARRATKRA